MARSRVAGASSPSELRAAPTAHAVLDGRWLVRGRDGRLTAYASAAGGLLRWTETRPGGPEWTGPEFFPAPGVEDLSLAQGTDGYVHFLGRRLKGQGKGAFPEVVHAIQYQTGRPLTEWRSVGNPHGRVERAVHMGSPVAAVSASGTVHVLVRNAGGGVCLRREDKRGAWLPWADLRGGGGQDGLAVGALQSGRIEALVTGTGCALHWSQASNDGDMERRPNLQVSPAPGSATMLETGPDRVTFYWTDLATGTVQAYRPGGWVIPMGSSPAEGRHAVARTLIDGYDCTVLAHRAVDGSVVLAACGTENEHAGVWWSLTGESSAHQPALALDARGRLVLAVIGAAGELRIARQGQGPGLVLGQAVVV
ncbi:hypothetical protein [Streptomyces sp. NRRL S-813]|uniref:hypothetical protein n=1 Tax=Streptomyces sp. NRRL S-813 TaxID=1463919 RepID=UPI0004C25782|nr:hypothetical protein [Streptomyces sp. NRRL S-813]